MHNLASNATRVEFTRFCQYLYPATHHENYWSHFLGHPDLGQDKVILSLNEPPPKKQEWPGPPLAMSLKFSFKQPNRKMAHVGMCQLFFELRFR
jgi:hypothetical protein